MMAGRQTSQLRKSFVDSIYLAMIAAIKKYKDNIATLKEFDHMEVYRWLIALGKKLNDDPLSEPRRTEANQVSYCQYQLYVDWEDNKFKAWSNAMIAAGYAYMLLDIFNSLPIEESKKLTAKHFEELDMQQLLSMNRQNGFYQMIKMMRAKIPK